MEFVWPPKGGSTPGTVIGPASSTDNAVARFNGVSGELIQNSGVIIDDSDNVIGVESLTIDGLTASRVLVTDASKKLQSSAVTTTTLGYLDATSSIQTQLDSKIPLTQKGVANGVATLDASTKIPQSQLPAIAITDTFVVGSQAAMLALSAETGDIAVRTDLNKTFVLAGSDPTILANWQELLTPTDTVLSVNGQTGAVVLSTSNISEGSNLYFTDERAQDAVGTILTDSSSVDFTYNDGANTISATVLPAGVDKNALGGSALSIANGGTGQTAKTEAYDALSPNTTKGDIEAHNGTNNVRLGVGVNGQVLQADSTASTGLKWADASTAGSTGINIVTNPSATSATTGWTAATNYTVSRDTSNSPLQGVVSTCFAISTTTASTETSTSGVYAAALTMPAALRNSKVQGNLWVTVPATSAGVWRLSVYNASGTRMSLDRDSSGVWTLPGGFTGQLPFTFDADSSASYTVSFTQTTRTSANTLYATLISIGNGQVSQTAPLGAYEEVSTYTITGSSVNPTPGAGATYYRNTFRDSEWAIIRYEYLQTASGSAGTGQYRLPVPSGLTVDTTKLGKLGTNSNNNYCGDGLLLATSSEFKVSAYYNPSAGAIELELMNDASAPATWGSTAGSFAANPLRLGVTVRLPISQWAGSVYTAPVPAEEYAYTTGSWDSSSSTTAYGPGGQALGGTLAADRTKTITWQYPIQQGDQVIVEGSRDGVTWAPMQGFLFAAGPVINSVDSGGGFAGVVWYNSSSTQTVVTFYSLMNRANDDTPSTNWPSSGAFWRVRKCRAASLPFALAGTDGSAGLVAPYSQGVGVVYAGTYTPTITAVTNVSSATLQAARYLRVGSVVTVSCEVAVDAIATGGTQVDISLPVPSNFTSSADCTGSGSRDESSTLGVVQIRGDVTNDRAVCVFVASYTAGPSTMTAHFTYTIK